MTQQTTQSPNMTGHTQTKDAAAHFRELQDIIARGEIAMMSGAEMLVQALIDEGVEYIFWLSRRCGITYL